MRSFKLVPIALLALTSTACATGRQRLATTTDLDLERVVLYRNGVGYFERHGSVDESVLRIRVRRDQVNDLLKSLTVVDDDGQAVSVSMPLDPETWAAAALSALAPGRGSLAQLLDGLRGTEVTLHTVVGRIRGRVVLVERSVDEPDPDGRSFARGSNGGGPSQRDYKVTVMRGSDLRVVRLSKVRDVTLHDGDLAMQLHRRLDAASGEGMFQQVEVAIRLVGAKEHDVSVSYVVAAPMWKPTYRVLLPESGKGDALLQGWAVVDNTSGEDWADVELALTSGEPIAFRYDLHTPRTVPRSDLTEAGVRKRAAVALGETSYGELDEEPEEEAEAFDDYAMADEAEGDFGGRGRYAEEVQRERRADKRAKVKMPASPKPSSRSSANLSGAVGGSMPGGGPVDRTSAVDLEALRRSTIADTRAKTVSGMTRYDLGERVTVPNGSSTMVAIINEDVAAEQTFLYRPGGAGIGYDANPYRVVRFKNSTPFVLEPGPISIYAGDSFVGEGLSEAVSTGTSATIPFAVEPSILVSSKAQYSGDEMHLLKISRGVLEVESFSRTTTTWSVKGKTATEPYTVLVRHGKAGWNYELVEPPEGTEVLPDAYLIPVTVPKGRTEGSTEVVEQTPSTTTISIWDGRALGLLETLVVSGDLTPDLKAKIQPVVDLRREIGRIDTQIDGLQKQEIALGARARETRASLEAIKKDPAANKLRKKLNDRLEEFTSEGDRVGRKIVELQSQRLEKKIALEDLLQDLDLTTPRAKAKKAEAVKK